jgi:hypothetical protein
MIQSDSYYIIDQQLNRHLCNYIALLSSLRQRIVLFEGTSSDISPIRFNWDQKYKHTRARHCRRSRAIPPRSIQSPSRPTASRSCLDLMMRQSGSGMRWQELLCRRSRAIQARSLQSPSRPTASRSCLDLTMRQSGSGMRWQELLCRRSRAIQTRSLQSPSRPTANCWICQMLGSLRALQKFSGYILIIELLVELFGKKIFLGDNRQGEFRLFGLDRGQNLYSRTDYSLIILPYRP